MRTFAHLAALAKQQWPEYRNPRAWLNAEDENGRSHVLRIDEAHIHLRSFSCRCGPYVKVNRWGVPVINHRRMRNSSALYQPWEDGH